MMNIMGKDQMHQKSSLGVCPHTTDQSAEWFFIIAFESFLLQHAIIKKSWLGLDASKDGTFPLRSYDKYAEQRRYDKSCRVAMWADPIMLLCSRLSSYRNIQSSRLMGAPKMIVDETRRICRDWSCRSTSRAPAGCQ